ncbi:MAG: FtsX-like permease family protein [Vicinamibacterales bacterium]
MLATMLFGALPAWRLGRATDDALREDVTTTVGGRRRRAGAASRSRRCRALGDAAGRGRVAPGQRPFQLRANPGFETAHLAVATIDLRRQRVPEAAVGPLMDRAIAAARGVPGVVGADAAMRAPLDMGQDRMAFGIPGYTNPEGTDRASIDFTAVTSGYFDTLGDPFVAGGAWNATAARTRPFAVVNETLVRRYFAGVSPVGRTIELVGLGPIPVSGVVADTAYYSIDEAPLPFVFLSAESQPPAVFQLHVRTSVPPAVVLGPLARGLAAADGRLAPSPVVTFEDLRRVPLFPARALAAAATAFGLLALGLTAIGLYGVATASVTQRTREIGVRLALGAQPGDVARAVMREAVGLALGGAAVGLAGAWLAGGALGGWLVGITRTSPGPYAGVVLLVSAVTMVAAWVPARRAARVDPVETLRRA